MARRAFQVGQGPGIVAIRRHCPSRAECAGRAVPGPAAGRPGDPGAGGRRVAGDRQRYRPWCGLALHDRGRPHQAQGPLARLQDGQAIRRAVRTRVVPTCGRPIRGRFGVVCQDDIREIHQLSPWPSSQVTKSQRGSRGAPPVGGRGFGCGRRRGPLATAGWRAAGGGWVGWPSRAAGGRRA
jgi:hypothetical protein